MIQTAVIIALATLVLYLLYIYQKKQMAYVEYTKELELQVKTLEEKEKRYLFEISQIHASKQLMQETFATLSQQVLENTQANFLRLAEENFGKHQVAFSAKEEKISATIKPIQEQMVKLQEYLHFVDKEQKGHADTIKEVIKGLIEGQRQLRSETTKLADALKAPTTRGQWGEMQLRRVIELAGLVEHCDFSTQETIHRDGQRLRPDVIIQLPAERCIIIDAKAPMSAYVELVECNEQDRAQLEQKHINAVKQHIDELSKKRYDTLLEGSIDFVILFLPAESMYVAAVAGDPHLFEWSMQRGVFLASASTLIPMLKAVAHTWRQELLSKQMQEITTLGKGLYESVVTFTEHLHDVGRKLKGVSEGYNKAIGSLERNFLPKARQFGKMNQHQKELVVLEEVDVPIRAVLTED